MILRLQNCLIWVAWKLSGKTKEHFGFVFNLAYFFNRSILRSTWHAMTDKGAPPQHCNGG